MPESGATNSEHCLQGPQRPPVCDLGTHSECTDSETNRANRAAETMGYFLDRFVSGPVQQPVVVRWGPRLGRCPAVGARFSRLGNALAPLVLFKAGELWGSS